MKKELWKTQDDADYLLNLVVLLLANEEFRRLLLMLPAKPLPVIQY